MFAPLINYGLGHVKDALSPWKYMYIFAGSITILWSVVMYFFLPPEPIRAKGFSERERYIAVARLRANNAGVRNTHIKSAQILEVLYDLRFWTAFLTAFCIMVANGPLSTYMPIIISGFGYSPLNSLLLSMPAGAIAGSFTILSTWLAGRYTHRGWRTWLVIGFQMPIILGALLLWQLPQHNKGEGLEAFISWQVLHHLTVFSCPFKQSMRQGTLRRPSLHLAYLLAIALVCKDLPWR